MCSFKCVYYKTRSSEPKKSEEEQRKLEEVNKSKGRITETERSKNFKIELNWKSKAVSLKRVANRKSLLKGKRSTCKLTLGTEEERSAQIQNRFSNLQNHMTTLRQFILKQVTFTHF